MFKLWFGAKMGHKVEVVVGACESMEGITPGLLITVSYFGI